MQHKYVLMLAAIFMTLASTLAAQDEPTIKCWINDDEVRECASAIPPKYARKGYQILSYEGIVLETIPPEKTKEEIERIKQEELAKKAEKEETERRRQEDERLLKRYPTENDMRIALEGRLDSIKAAIQVNRDQIEYFRQDLEQTETALQNNIKETRSAGNAGIKKQLEAQTESLKDRINDIKEQIARFENEIVKKQKERDTAQATFQTELDRYRQIRWR